VSQRMDDITCQKKKPPQQPNQKRLQNIRCS
jgi:hypothetical protein